MRAIEPVEAGTLSVADFEIGYEVFGAADAPPVLLLPAWQIVHSRIWKLQVPYLARCCRVIAFDSPGNGRGERTTEPGAFEYDRIIDQAVGLLDHLHIARASVIGLSRGCIYGLWMAARYPERVTRLVCIANGTTPGPMPTPDPRFWQERPAYTGWHKRNAHYWHADFRGMRYETTTTLAPERALAAAEHFFAKEFPDAGHHGRSVCVHPYSLLVAVVAHVQPIAATRCAAIRVLRRHQVWQYRAAVWRMRPRPALWSTHPPGQADLGCRRT